MTSGNKTCMKIGRTLVTTHHQVGWSDEDIQDEAGIVFNIRIAPGCQGVGKTLIESLGKFIGVKTRRVHVCGFFEWPR